MSRLWRILAVASCGWIAFLSILLSAESIAKQYPPPPPPPPPGYDAQNQQANVKPVVGTGKITGQVVAADNGAPVRRVVVMVSGGPQLVVTAGRSASSASPAQDGQSQPMPQRGQGPPPGWVSKQLETDGAGRFIFSGLPAGRFSVMVNLQGGFIRPQSETVLLADGGASAVIFKLERTGAITGRILDEFGDPLPRAQVRASRWQSVGGTRRLSSVGGGGNPMTDDRGEYRLFDLPAGEYFIAVSYPYTMYSASSEPFDPQEPRTGFAPTLYPGTTSPDGARPVTVRAGQDTAGVDITLQRARMGRIVGTVVSSTGAPMSQRGMVSMTSKSEAFQGGSGITRRPDGTFTSNDVPPGEYYVFAQETFGNGPDATREGVSVPVFVNGDEVSVHLQMNRGATISGHVVIEGTQPDLMSISQPSGNGPANQSRVMVISRSATIGASYIPVSSGGRPAPMAEDGTFTMTGLRGTIRLGASASNATLKSVQRGAQDILATPLELTGTENITDVEIVLTTDTGKIDGTVLNASGEPAGNAFVLIFSDDASRWFEGSSYVRQTRTLSADTRTASASGMSPSAPPGQASPLSSIRSISPGIMASSAARGPGQFPLISMIPGRYGVVAIESSGSSQPAYDAEALEKLKSKATFVTVTAGQTATVQITTIKQ